MTKRDSGADVTKNVGQLLIFKKWKQITGFTISIVK